MKRSLLLIVATVLGSTAATRAQSYTLEECTTLALENNRTLQNSRLDAQISTETRREAFTKFFPTVAAGGMAFYAGDEIMKLSVPINLPIPGLSLPPLSMGMMKHGLIGGVTAVQPLFAGRQVAAGNRLARIGEEVGGLKVAVSERDVRETVQKYYWQLIALRGKLQTLDMVEQQLSRIRSDVETAIRAGISTHNDLLRVELKQQEVTGSRLKVENGLTVYRLLLAQYVGIPQGEPFEIASPSDSLPTSPEEWYTDALEAAERRPEAQLLGKNLEAAKQQIRMTRGKNMPTVGVGAGYLYHDLTGQDNDFGMVFASVSVPITSWWGGSHAVKREQLRQRQAENERRQAVEMMEVEIRQCWHETCEAYEQILLAQKSIASATENLRLNADYYRAGTAALSDLLEAQTLLQQSRDQLTDATADYRVKLARYRLVTGQ